MCCIFIYSNVGVNCGAPDLPTDTTGFDSVMVNATTFNSTAIYSCINGYNIVGNPVRTCQANGDWSDSAPMCESKTEDEFS